MKRKNVFSLLLFLAVFSFSSFSFAQPGKGMHGKHQGKGCHDCMRNLPNMSDDQLKKIDAIATTHLKEILDIRNQLGEKQAHLRTLESATNANINEINKSIEEIGALKITIQKKGAAVKQSIRTILTEEQRVLFDMHKCMIQKCLRSFQESFDDDLNKGFGGDPDKE